MTTQSDNTRIFHNPRCSKSRATLALLTENGETPDIIEYLKTPPSADELRHVLTLLGLQPRDLMRKNESVYKDNNLKDESLSNDQLIEAMLTNPILIERPIVIKGNQAVIGRPPENIMDII